MNQVVSSVPEDYFSYNAMLNILDDDGNIQFDKDKVAVRQYFLQHVNKNMVFFHDLNEKLEYCVENGYYDKELLDKYTYDDIKDIFKFIYSFKFRFTTFQGAYKFYKQYALLTNDGQRYLERLEDRVAMCSLYLGDGSVKMAKHYAEEIITGRYQPATPTFLNAGRKQRGEPVSCFLINVSDSMDSIGRSINSALQLSKRGGGVALGLSDIREAGAPIKGRMGAARGLVPIMKLYEDAFTYADQLGQRDGAGAVYVHVNHPDIMEVLDTKRENADEKIRIKTLSIGIIIPDIMFELAEKNDVMYLFSPYDVMAVYGKPLSMIGVTKMYHQLVADKRIRKKKVNPRKIFEVIAKIEGESGYPYLMFEDVVNDANPIDGYIRMSNLCSEILQVQTDSVMAEDGSYEVIGKDISCNLGSLNVLRAFESPDFGKTVEIATRALTVVSDNSNINCVPSIHKGNKSAHAIGLGAMNLHGFFGYNEIEYGSEESIDFTNLFFMAVNYHSILTSCKIAMERKTTFEGFEKSKYADGSYFDFYINGDWEPKTQVIRDLFAARGFVLPTNEDWLKLCDAVKEHGLYNQNRLAIPPTGSISYINNSTSSIHPIASRIEIRKEGKTGRTYYPAPHMTNENLKYFKDAYEIGPFKIIDVYAAATPHIDQGLSLTLFLHDNVTTRFINQVQIYARKKKIKTIYYIRLRKSLLSGTEVEGCVSCAL